MDALQAPIETEGFQRFTRTEILLLASATFRRYETKYGSFPYKMYTLVTSLSSDGESYRDALRAAGGRAHWSEVKGMVHACLRARTLSDRAAGFFDEVVSAIADLGQGRWPYP